MYGIKKFSIFSGRRTATHEKIEKIRYNLNIILYLFYTFEYLSSHKNIKNVKSIVGVSPTMV